MANEYKVDYDDSRFTQVEAEKNGTMAELEQTYDSMIGQSDSFYQSQIDASKEWAEKQEQLQQEQTDFAIEQIQQQKDQAKKDYTKEQNGAYKDWQKQSNQYGANAEAMASQGMGKTGYSESAQVSMYNTYQNRIATAREAYTKAVQDYDNAMTEARLQNNATLAEIAANALQQQLELALSAFQYKNQLLLDKIDKKTTMDQMYYNRYQDVLAQINQENALAEEVRQYNKSLEEEKRQYDIAAKADGIEIKKDGESDDDEDENAGETENVKQATEDEVRKSVLELGYGPLSASELADKIESGEVMIRNDGTVRKGSTSNGRKNVAESALLGKLQRAGLLTESSEKKSKKQDEKEIPDLSPDFQGRYY